MTRGHHDIPQFGSTCSAHEHVTLINQHFRAYPPDLQHRLFESCLLFGANDGFTREELMQLHQFLPVNGIRAPGFTAPLWTAYVQQAVEFRKRLLGAQHTACHHDTPASPLQPPLQHYEHCSPCDHHELPCVIDMTRLVANMLPPELRTSDSINRLVPVLAAAIEQYKECSGARRGFAINVGLTAYAC